MSDRVTWCLNEHVRVCLNEFFEILLVRIRICYIELKKSEITLITPTPTQACAVSSIKSWNIDMHRVEQCGQGCCQYYCRALEKFRAIFIAHWQINLPCNEHPNV